MQLKNNQPNPLTSEYGIVSVQQIAKNDKKIKQQPVLIKKIQSNKMPDRKLLSENEPTPTPEPQAIPTK